MSASSFRDRVAGTWRRLRSGDHKADGSVSVWNTLEVAKLALGALTPILIAGVGAVLASQSERHARDQQRQFATVAAARESSERQRQSVTAAMTTLVNKRISILDQLLPLIENNFGYAVIACQDKFPGRMPKSLERENLDDEHARLKMHAAIRVYFSTDFVTQELLFFTNSDNAIKLMASEKVWRAYHDKVCPAAVRSHEDLLNAIPPELGQFRRPETAVLPGSLP